MRTLSAVGATYCQQASLAACFFLLRRRQAVDIPLMDNASEDVPHIWVIDYRPISAIVCVWLLAPLAVGSLAYLSHSALPRLMTAVLKCNSKSCITVQERHRTH